MSRIDELVREFCPNGVETVELGTVLDYSQPTHYLVKSTQYNDLFATPVLTAGQTFVLGMTNETEGIYPASDENPVIIFDDFTTAFKWVTFPFKAKSSAMKMITLSKETKASFRFIFYAMNCIRFVPSEHSRHWIGTYSKFKIPLPPMEVQLEIVRILDAMTSLQAELQAELAARKTQYEYYRDSLLNFTTSGTPPVRWMTLGEVVRIRNGRDYKQLEQGSVPVYGSGGIMTTVGTPIYEKPSVLIPRKGSLNKLYYLDSPFWTVDTIFYTEIDDALVIPKFVYYYLATRHLEELNEAGGVPSLTQAVLNKQPFPVPSIEEQERIVELLDKFDALTTDISIGLPAEIEARRKQYEYYRDKLLTFKELAA